MVGVGELGQDLKALESTQCYDGQDRDLSVGGNFANGVVPSKPLPCPPEGIISVIFRDPHPPVLRSLLYSRVFDE